MSCATIKHDKHGQVTCINYAGDFVDKTLFDELYDGFLKEEV